MKLIKNSLKNTLETIKRNKFKIFSIFFLQVLFLIALSITSYKTMLPAMDHAKSALDYYDTINITEDSGTFGYLGEDPLLVYKSYNSILYYFKIMGISFVLAFIIINSLIWALTDNLVNKKNLKQFLTYLLNFTLLTISFILIFYITIFNTLKSSLIDLQYNLLPLIGTLLVSLILFYFLFTSYSLIQKRKIKEISKLIFKIGILKFPSIILIYLINLAIILLFIYLIYLTIELNIFLLSIMMVLLILSLVFTKLFLITAVNDLVKKL